MVQMILRWRLHLPAERPISMVETVFDIKAADTLEYAANFLPESAVHPIHQLQFARAVKKLETAVIGRSSCTNFPVIQGLCPYSSPAVVPRHPIRMAG